MTLYVGIGYKTRNLGKRRSDGLRESIEKRRNSPSEINGVSYFICLQATVLGTGPVAVDASRVPSR